MQRHVDLALQRVQRQRFLGHRLAVALGDQIGQPHDDRFDLRLAVREGWIADERRNERLPRQQVGLLEQSRRRLTQLLAAEFLPPQVFDHRRGHAFLGHGPAIVRTNNRHVDLDQQPAVQIIHQLDEIGFTFEQRRIASHHPRPTMAIQLTAVAYHSTQHADQS